MWHAHFYQTMEDILLTIRQQNKQYSDSPKQPKVSPAGELTNKLRKSKQTELHTSKQKSSNRHLQNREA